MIRNAVTYAGRRHSHSHYPRHPQADLAKPKMSINQAGHLQNWWEVVGTVTGQPPDTLKVRGAQLISSTSHRLPLVWSPVLGG